MKQHIISMLTVGILSLAIALPASAEGRHEGHGEGHHEMGGMERHKVRNWSGERDIRHFENRHLEIWRGGNWHHSRHEGRFGWWWVTAGVWYFYPFPIYPYPDPYIPPVVVVQPNPAPPTVQPPVRNWYYCEASKSYYPYVSSCPAGWKTVPATPPDVPAS